MAPRWSTGGPMLLITTIMAITTMIMMMVPPTRSLSSLGKPRAGKHQLKQGGSVYQGMSKSLKNGGLFPSVINVASKAEIKVNATCGEDGPEMFCKPSESSRCAICDALSPDPNKRHSVNQALDSSPLRWWQSPTLARGDDYEYVTITLDLKQMYQIEYVILKAANSPRPAAWLLERSIDGDRYEPWQYYAPSDEECWTRYSMPPVLGKPTYSQDNEVICTSFYSRATPMENGEIHTQLVNGRPGALNHSQAIQDFTQARFVRLRFQGLRRRGEALVDKRRAFYSVREINIGGRCLCSGHSSKCLYNSLTRRQECECERHTCGESCDKCCPMYNQVAWRPGTSGKGFHCEKCNCHGHATSCRYDPGVAELQMSIDVRGRYRGGGVCLDCADHTTGINCEKCEDGYYRPDGVQPGDPEPCVPCDCHDRGSTGSCVPESSSSLSHQGKVAGACECKRGYSGHKCDRCAAGYRRFPDCLPCPCDSRGVLPSHDCEAECVCKSHVVGQFCQSCAPGYFGLSRENPDGCLACFCSGLSRDCHAANITYRSLVSTLEGWQVSDINASRAVAATIQSEHGWPTFASFEVEYRSPYWLAPRSYAGNRLSSYGSNLTFLVSWIIMRGDTSGRATTEPDVILIGKNGLRIAYGEESHPGQEAEVVAPLLEQNWYHVELRPEIVEGVTRFRRRDYRGESVTRNEMLSILADLEHLLIRAQYHTEQIEGSLKVVALPIGETSLQEGSTSLVEMCFCPMGYAGLSCEKCDYGYVEVPSNSSNEPARTCVKCDCSGHSGSCNLLTGDCGKCDHNTLGAKCDRCGPGYYGDATKGKPDDCLKCACPLDIPSNNFSPSCQMDDDNDSKGYVCTQCPLGYTGDHCETCDTGFFGNPLIPGSTCEPCRCYGGTCDHTTGRCLECRGNTEGWKCEKCKKEHYGDPSELNCLPCSCNPLGASSTNCEPRSGQCACRALFDGRDCSRCIEGYGNVTAGCVECDCGVGAADDGQCDPVTGSCNCNPGTLPPRCDHCLDDHYGLSFDGCYACGCHPSGSLSASCDIVTGQCRCKTNVIGRQCDRCLPDHWGLMRAEDGCTECECNLVGSVSSSCDNASGQCQCRPGVGGLRCDSCLPGHYGFSPNGCQACEPCNREGHVCDPLTGRCSCPGLSVGERCERCRPGSYDPRPGLGCRACGCSAAGSLKQHCNQLDGQCPCREGFAGQRCDRCAPGYFDYPRCRACSCDPRGSLQDVCDHRHGQCPCKANVLGRRCDECKESTFGLAADNPAGCTECFCFGRASECREAGLSWGQRRLARARVLYVNDTVNEVLITNYGSSTMLLSHAAGSSSSNKTRVSNVNLVPGTDGDVTLPVNYYRDHPLYWQLPDSFLGDKIMSYGGFIRFTTVTEGGHVLRSGHTFPLVQLQGNGIFLEYYHPPNSTTNDGCYVIRLHESIWQLKNRPEVKVTRELLMLLLQRLELVYVKASDFTDFSRATLLDASMDVAILTATHAPPLASSVEQCVCPPEYNGTSCQDPSRGYYRSYESSNSSTSTSIISNRTKYDELIGRARPCACNDRSEVCDPETGHCFDCKGNTAGPGCEVCAESYYGEPDSSLGCRECPCPHTDKKFSNTCVVSSDADKEVVCVCKPGYAGSRCESCSYGHYGYPSSPGGSCEPCRCNAAGSASDECDLETGQCNCRPGSTGRDCSRCIEERHVYIGLRCESCNDNCTGLLLDELEDLKYELANATTHISSGYIAPPWVELAYIDDNVTIMHEELLARRELFEGLERVPWHDYKLLPRHAAILLNDAIDQANEARILKSQSGDIENNVYSLKMELETLLSDMNATVNELFYYGNDDKKVEIKKTLKEAKALLAEMKSLDLHKRAKPLELIIDECTKYSDWFDELVQSIEPLSVAQGEARNLSLKLKDATKNLESTMETMYAYDTLYNEVNMTYEVLSFHQEGIADMNSIIEESLLNQASVLIEQAKSCILDGESNLKEMPRMKEQVVQATANLSTKEEILYRLNYEYKNKYVVPATEHAQNLSNYVDQYVGLFSETRAQAANPLKASQAYKNIANGLAEAKEAAEDANIIIDGARNQIYPAATSSSNNNNNNNNDDDDSLLEKALDTAIQSNEQLERTKNHTQPISHAKAQLESQKQSVARLKDSLNSTGNKDNQINVKLRELQGDSRKTQERLNAVLNENKETMNTIIETRQLVEDYQKGIVEVLHPKLQELKREGDSRISLASEKLAEAQSNIKRADAKLSSFAIAAVKRQEEFDKWNGTLAAKLQILKDKIAEARNTADGIRISVKSAVGKRCMRSYRPKNLQPSSTTTIVMTFAIPNNQREGPLFYLPSSTNDDFVALEMYERRIRFVWNVGGGTGVVTHPEIIEAGNPDDDSSWYRIEAERIKHIGKLSVQKQLRSSTGGGLLPEVNYTSSEFGRLDVSSVDRLWLGGLPEIIDMAKPAELLASSSGLPGCVHQLILDEQHIGLWNFVSDSADDSCQPCVEGVENFGSDVTYSFNGEGYAVRSRVNSGPYNKYVFGVSINFRTYDENALLFLAIDPNNPEGHVMIFLREGRVVVRIMYGGNISTEMTSANVYNTGNWTKVDAFRQFQPHKAVEKCSFSVNGENDKKIGSPMPQPSEQDIPDMSEAKYYFGGVPPSFRIAAESGFALPSQSSFLGCMSNINVQEGYDPMAEHYYGVEPGCRNRPMTKVGFHGDGYLELRGFQLRKVSSSIGFSFRTLQSHALLLLSTFLGPESRLFGVTDKESESIKDNYYSVAVIEGRIQVRVNGGQGEIIVETNGTFNDGKYHAVIVAKKRKEIELRIDDAYQTSEKLPSGAAVRAPESGGLYFGGLPNLINDTKMVSTNAPLKGAIKDVILAEEFKNGNLDGKPTTMTTSETELIYQIVKFEDAVSFKRAYIGRDGPRMTGTRASGLEEMDERPPSYSVSASLSRGLMTQPEGCVKVPYYSLEPGALKFGDKPQSHTQLYLNFDNFWAQKKMIEFDFRTYYPNGLLFITPGTKVKNYLTVMMRDGQLILIIKSKRKKEIVFRTPLNDGNWHHVAIGHGSRKLTMVVDSQTPQAVKVPKKIGLTNVMYIGGIPESGTPLPEQVVAKLESLKGCIRGLKVNGNVYDMVGSTSRPYNVGQCFPHVESGAYFQDEAYAVYRDNFELGAVLELQLEFRTSELSGVLLSISGPGGSPALSMELHNGKVVMSSDFGYKQPLSVEQDFTDPYAVCDNRWHRIQAVYNEDELTLKLDQLDQKYGLPTVMEPAHHAYFASASPTTPTTSTSIIGSLYIGGLPTAANKGTLRSRDHFNGCIRNVVIGGERRDWTDMVELHNIHLNSCPVQ